MSKLMTVDILSSIKGAKPSEAVNKLFEVIKNADANNGKNMPHFAYTILFFHNDLTFS